MRSYPENDRAGNCRELPAAIQEELDLAFTPPVAIVDAASMSALTVPSFFDAMKALAHLLVL